MLVAMASCGKQSEKPRKDTFLAVEQPVKFSDLTLPGLVRNAQGEFLVTLFIHSRFPSATDAHDAIAVLKSADDGRTWSEIARIPSHVTYGVWGYDLAINKDDRLHMTWVAALRKADSPQPFKAVLFSRSDDGGHSWTDPVQVSGATTGQRRNPVIAVSSSDIHIAWLDEQQRATGARGQNTVADVYCGSSTDRGATWGDSTCLEADLSKKKSSSGTPSLCVGPDGAVYCAYSSLRSDRRGGFWIARSRDQGKTFTATPYAKGAFGNICLTQTDGKLCVAAVHIKGIKQISMQDPQTYQEIRFYSSSDGGDTWTKPVLIDDDPDDRRKNNVKLAAVGPGRLLACWHDERGGVFMAASMDGGKTWGKNLRVADRSHTGITPLDMTVDLATGVFHLALSDVRQGSGDATSFLKGEVRSPVQQH